jgi:flagellar assembly protein FliH
LSRLLKAQQTSLAQESYHLRVQPVMVPRPAASKEESELESVRLAALQEAEEVLAKAKEEARRILAQAEAEASELLERERQNVQLMLQAEVEEAKSIGYQDGFAQGAKQAEAEYAAKLQEAEELYASAVEERRLYLSEAEPMIVDLAIEVAKKIMHRETSVDRSYVVDVVRAALEEMHDGGKVEVRVHPDDHEVVQQSRERLRKEVPGTTELIIIKDTSVEAGGCVVCTAFGNIDARIDTQLEEVRKALQEVAATLER